MTGIGIAGDPPAPPPGTAELFGDRWPQAQRYAELLCREAVTWGLVGPRETPRIWQRHIRNSLAVAAFIPTGSAVIDIGSGAGLPGVPLALARPDLRVTLVESMARRVQFLHLVVEHCNLATVSIEHARAEQATVRADVVVCRAVAPAQRLLPWAHHLTDGNGSLVALKGQSVADEVAEVQAVIRQRPSIRWRPASIEVVQVTEPDAAVALIARWRGPVRQSIRPQRHSGNRAEEA